ncbi:N-acetyltransferase family protein [Bacillus sp. AK031]
MEAGERNTTPEQQRKQIERIKQQRNSTIFVAEETGNLIGYLLVIGILKEQRGKGIGTKLFESVSEWAKKNNISRLELTAVTNNEVGVALYKKSGFEIEGTKRNSLIIDGRTFSEFYMSKVL